MIWSHLITISLIFSWMVSPDALVLLGNSAGKGGLPFIAALAIGAALSVLCAKLIYHPDATGNTSDKTAPHTFTIGQYAATTLTVATRISLVVLLPTGMLVTAGFTFNETFVYWFPNFGFSFILLGLILTLHLTGERFAEAAQLLFTGIVIFCLLLLSLAGLFGTTPEQVYGATSHFNLPLPLICGALLLYLGYDQPSPDSNAKWYILLAIIGGFVLFSLWTVASLRHVAPEKLASSTVPYIISATKILGTPGKALIGIAIIAGGCSVTNGLFILANKALLQQTDLFPSFINHFWKRRIYPIVFSVAIGLSMILGLAGDELLETYIRGALLLWIAATAFRCLIATRRIQLTKSCSFHYGYLISALFLLAALYLTVTDNYTTRLFSFFVLTLVVSAIVTAGGYIFHRPPPP